MFLSNGRVQIKEINQWGPNSGRMVLHITLAISWMASHHPAFMGNCPTISHMFPPQTSDRIPNADPTRGAANLGIG